MENEIQLIPEKIHIIDFKILKGQIESTFELEAENIEDFESNVELELGFNSEDKFVKADLKVKVNAITISHENEKATGSFHFVFIFHIENLEELTEEIEGEEELLVSDLLGNAIASITYSTARGILMTRFQGTVLEGFILPVIDPNDLL